MHKITPHLWYDTQAREAGELYTSVFRSEKPPQVVTIHDTPSGSVDIVDIELLGVPFQMISAGPLFKFNPSISFLVQFDSKDEVDRVWRELGAGGAALMPLDSYPFSERYGWLQDRFGLSWQLMYAGDRPIAQRIIPTLMYTEQVAGRAEEAIDFYTSVFPHSSSNIVMRWEAGEGPDKPGTVKHAGFKLDNCEFAAMDSAHGHGFTFNEAISLVVRCNDQQEIDYYWDKLSADPNAEQCGWLKDKFGVSWQIVPAAMDRMMAEGTKEQVAAVTQAFLPMKKFDLAKLEEAYRSAS